MRFDLLKAVISCGDSSGSAIRQMLRDLKICNLSNVTDAQAEWWLAKQRGGDGDGHGDNHRDTEIRHG